jgi:dynactin complex subunit
MRQEDPLSPFLFNIVLKFLATAIRQNEELKVIQIVKVVVKLSIFPNYMILDIKDLKNSTPKLLDTINRFTNVAGYKINLQNSVAFYIPKMNRLRKNI